MNYPKKPSGSALDSSLLNPDKLARMIIERDAQARFQGKVPGYLLKLIRQNNLERTETPDELTSSQDRVYFSYRLISDLRDALKITISFPVKEDGTPDFKQGGDIDVTNNPN